MGKIILEFDSQEESTDARTALDGYKWKIAVWDLDQKLCRVTKYGTFNGRESTEAEQEMADRLREFIRETLSNHNLNLED